MNSVNFEMNLYARVNYGRIYDVTFRNYEVKKQYLAL